MRNNFKKMQKKDLLSIVCQGDEEQFTFSFRTTFIRKCNEIVTDRIQKLRHIKPEIDWIYCYLDSNTLSTNFQPQNYPFAFCLCLRNEAGDICEFKDIFHEKFNRYVSLLNFSCAATKGNLSFDTSNCLEKWLIEFTTVLSVSLSIASNNLGNEHNYDIFERIAEFAWNNTDPVKPDSQFKDEQFVTDFISKCQQVLDENLIEELRDPSAFFRLRCKNSGNFPVDNIMHMLSKLEAGVYSILFLVKKPKMKKHRQLVQTIFEKSNPKINNFIIVNEEKYFKNKNPIGLISHLIGEYRIRL